VTTERQPPPGAVIGALLIVIGLAFLAIRYLDTFADVATWPLFIVVPGAALFVLGLILPNTGMIIGGTVVTANGFLLMWQSTTGYWATWAYAWALIGPTASGVGTVIAGLRVGNRKMATGGLWAIVVGLALFIGFYLLFEEVIGLTGFRLPIDNAILPVIVIGLGIAVLASAFLAPREHESPS
jgi:hypothetical protein